MAHATRRLQTKHTMPVPRSPVQQCASIFSGTKISRENAHMYGDHRRIAVRVHGGLRRVGDGASAAGISAAVADERRGASEGELAGAKPGGSDCRASRIWL
eukprot:3531385-Rhodomonas_salina.1